MDKKGPKKERPTYNMWQNTWFMVKVAWKVCKVPIYQTILLAALLVGINLAELFVVPTILDKVETAAPLGELLLTILCFAGTLMVLSGVHTYVQTGSLMGSITVRLAIINLLNQKTAMTSYPNTEDVEFLKKQEKASNATGSNAEACEAIWGTWVNLLRDLTGFVIYLLLLSGLDPVLILATVVTAVVGYFINKRIREWEYRHREEKFGYEKKLSYVQQKAEDIKLAKDIRIFGMRTWLEDIYSSTMRLYDAFILRREKAYIWANVVDVVLSFLRNGIAYFYLIGMAISAELSAAEFLLYMTAAGGFTTWVTGILSGFSTLHQQSMGISTVREYLDAPEPFRFEDGKPLPVVQDGDYELELKNVSFRYPGAEEDTIHQMNLIIRPGEKLAIVGLNGAGKTTLVKLLCGFYDPTEGQVLLNGEDIRQYNRRDYYKHFTAVFQQFSVLDVSVAENVAQTYEPDMERVKDCVAKAGLTEAVETMAAGYETRIGKEVYNDGIDLSGGQMQRLMLARALYKDAPILMLDEPTAALDPIAENDIYLKYNEMTVGRTSVFISHRLASTRFCDRIIYLEGGVIAEEGSHDSLMSLDGRYAELFRVQSKYYQEGEGKNEEGEE